jgi:hypothetical protein
MQEDAMPVFFKLLDDGSGDCMVEAPFMGMGKDDRYLHGGDLSLAEISGGEPSA